MAIPATLGNHTFACTACSQLGSGVPFIREQNANILLYNQHVHGHFSPSDLLSRGPTYVPWGKEEEEEEEGRGAEETIPFISYPSPFLLLHVKRGKREKEEEEEEEGPERLFSPSVFFMATTLGDRPPPARRKGGGKIQRFRRREISAIKPPFKWIFFIFFVKSGIHGE